MAQFRRKYPLTEPQIDFMASLWRAAPLTAREIAALLGVTKNVVIGHAHRRDWGLRRAARAKMAKTTLNERLDALHRRMDELCGQTRAPAPDVTQLGER